MLLQPDRVGPISDLERDLRWSPAELAAAVGARRAALARLGARPGARVLIAHGGSPEFFADLLATWSLGAAAVCVDPQLTAPELANLTAFAEPVAVLVREATPAGALPVPVTDLGREAAAGEDPAPVPAAPDDPALILFTSGTTGEPKGVVHSFASLAARIALNRRAIGDATLARTLCVLPSHFGHGLIGNCLTPLAAGGALLLPGTGPLQAAAALGALVSAERISFMSSVPSFWKLALKTSRPPAASGLARIHIGSAPLGAALWQAVCAWSGTADVVNCYGITETANWIAGASAAQAPPEDGLVGQMWGGTAATFGADGAPAEEGELAVRTPSVMQGYFRRPDLTAAVLREGWFFTGDSGRIAPDGTIRLTGRLKDEINRGGLKVQPAEIDLLVERHPDVVEACSFALPDEASGELVAIAVRLVPQAVADTDALRAWCRDRIRREAVPERWFVLPDIPRTERGKLNRALVRARCLNEIPVR